MITNGNVALSVCLLPFDSVAVTPLEALSKRENRMKRRKEGMLSTPAYFCAQIILTPLSHIPFSVSQVTIAKVPPSVGAATQPVNAATPPCGRSSPPGHAVVDGWRRDERTRDTPQSLPRALVSSAKPTPAVQVVRSAAPSTASTRSLRMPTEQGRPTRDSTIRCWLMPSVLRQDGSTPTPTIVRQDRFDPLFMVDLLHLAPPDGPSCGSCDH